MKTIYEIFIISIIGVLLFSGVGLINEYMFLKGGLDEESQNMVGQYDTVLRNLTSKYDLTQAEMYDNEDSLNNIEVETDVNTLDEFVKEYGEAKQKIGILRQGMNMVTRIPDMVLLSVPFVEQDDLTIYKAAIFSFLIMVIGIAIIRALFQRKVATSN